DADSPGRLDVVLAEHVGSRAKAARLIEAGLVTVDGSARPKSFGVERGMRIAVAPEPVPELDTRGGDVEFAIVYEDDDLLVVAKSEEAHRKLQDQLRRREIGRSYIALVEGRPDARSGTIDAAIGRDRGRRTVVSTRTDRPRHAVTHFEVEEELPQTTLLR